MDLVQGRLWEDAPPPTAAKRESGRKARASRPAVEYVAVPLFGDLEEVAPPPERVLPTRPPSEQRLEPPHPEGADAAESASTGESAPTAESPPSAERARVAQRSRAAEAARSAPKPGGGRGRGAAAVSAAADPGMEAAAEWVEQILDEPGKAAGLVRRFVELFPPSARWESEEAPPFLPSAAGYAAALRDVATGRVRVRLTGRWASGEPGALVAAKGRGDEGWSVVDREGLAPEESEP